ncbi:MAG TPA: hypothetical protein VIL35_05890 [Vicinamibacterales bacterium]
MICRNCGTEIADKAIICYRCGQATFEAKRKPAPPPSRGGSLVVILGLIVLIVAALFLGQAGTDQVPPAVSWTLAALASIVLMWRLLARRRR